MRIHPITGMTLEDGFGALRDDEQAAVLHVPYIELTQGAVAADAMRKELGIPTKADIEAAAASKAAEEQEKADRIVKALALLDQHEAEEAAIAAATAKTGTNGKPAAN